MEFILFLFILLISLISNFSYIVERDAHPYGPLIRVGRIEVLTKVSEINLMLFFCLYLYRRERKGGHALLSNHINTLEMGYGHVMTF